MRHYNIVNRSQEENILLKCLEDAEIEIFDIDIIRELTSGKL